jgi:predicted kinase
MHLIVISGLPCSGKSKLAERLQAELCWPLLCKDNFKELLFDHFGYSDRAWSRRVSAAAYALLFSQAEQLLSSNLSCVLEGNFRWAEHQARFERLQALGATILQVHCCAEPDVLLERFRLRAVSGSRHPGHVDLESMREIENEMRTTTQQPLPLSGLRGNETIRCDTSSDWQAAIAVSIDRIKQALAS